MKNPLLIALLALFPACGLWAQSDLAAKTAPAHVIAFNFSKGNYVPANYSATSLRLNNQLSYEMQLANRWSFKPQLGGVFRPHGYRGVRNTYVTVEAAAHVQWYLVQIKGQPLSGPYVFWRVAAQRSQIFAKPVDYGYWQQSVEFGPGVGAQWILWRHLAVNGCASIHYSLGKQYYGIESIDTPRRIDGFTGKLQFGIGYAF